jgi:hypothetical protein
VEPTTCGQGLAANAVIPAHMSALALAMADVLEVHTSALDTTDPHAKVEHDIYAGLVAELRDIAAQLEVVADEMSRSRDMPVAAHDERAMTDAEPLEAFEELIAAKGKLHALLQQQSEHDHQMLVQMRGASGVS